MADRGMAVANACATSVQWSTGVVKAVLSGDTIVIVDNSSSTSEIPCERTVTLLGIMAPRLARKTNQDDQPFAWQSRMFLRNYCLGKEVQYHIERTIPSTRRNFGTVYVGSRNLSAVMVVNSLAWVRNAPQEGGSLRRQKVQNTVKRDPEELELTNASDLIAIQNKVKEAGYGVWSKKREEQEKAVRCLPPSPLDGYDDFDCQTLFNAIKGKKVRAFVEYLRDGSALRVYLLPHFYFIQVFVQGVKCPSTRRGDNNGKEEIAPEPFAREAKHFVEVRLLNRDVLLTIDGCDPFGNFSGTVTYKEGDEEKNLALQLLQNGFARYLDSSGRRLDKESQNQLKQAQLTARNNHNGIWKDYVEPVVQNSNKGSEDETKQGKNNTRVSVNEGKRYQRKSSTRVFANPIKFKPKQTLKVGITEVLAGGKIYFRTFKEHDVVFGVQEKLQNLTLQNVSHAQEFLPKRGDIVLAQYTADGSWNRAKIVDAPSSTRDTFEVLYIDYGNQENVPLSKMRPFPSNAYSGPGLAHLCSLAYIKVPEEFGEEAIEYLSQYTTREIILTIEEIVKVQKQDMLLVTLIDSESGTNINAALLEEGLASLRTDNVDRKKNRYAAFESLRKHELEAKQKKKNIWSHNNCS